MPDRPIRICLILHSSRSDNLGVGALTVSEIAVLRGVADGLGRSLEITLMDPRAARAPYVGGDDIRIIDLRTKTLLNPFGYAAVVWRSDVVIDIGAGDSFADIYGISRIRRMMIMKFLCHLLGTPLVMAPQTIGPFSRPLTRRLARWTMNLSAVVATRDAMSTRAVAELGVSRQVVEASDLALRLPYDLPVEPSPKGAVHVGLNVSGLLMSGGYTGKNEFGLVLDYPALIRGIITYFQSHPDGCVVHLVSHVIVPEGPMQAEDDYRASKALCEEFPGCVLAPAFASPSDAKTYIAGLDFFMGARMHACIAAFSSGVPVVPMAYSRKFAGLFGTLGYDWTVDCTSQSDEDILSRIREAYAARDQVEADRAVALSRGLDKISGYQAALHNLLAPIVDSRHAGRKGRAQ